MKTTAMLAATLLACGLLLGGCKARQSQEPAPVSAGMMEPLPPLSDTDYSVAPPVSPGPEPYNPPPAAGDPSLDFGTAAGGGASSGGVYVVQRGDTLTGIARKVYGDPSRVRDIVAANPEITNPNVIKVGQRINLP